MVKMLVKMIVWDIVWCCFDWQSGVDVVSRRQVTWHWQTGLNAVFSASEASLVLNINTTGDIIWLNPIKKPGVKPRLAVDRLSELGLRGLRALSVASRGKTVVTCFGACGNVLCEGLSACSLSLSLSLPLSLSFCDDVTLLTYYRVQLNHSRLSSPLRCVDYIV